jgi:hypothetical protein
MQSLAAPLAALQRVMHRVACQDLLRELTRRNRLFKGLIKLMMFAFLKSAALENSCFRRLQGPTPASTPSRDTPEKAASEHSCKLTPIKRLELDSEFMTQKDMNQMHLLCEQRDAGVGSHRSLRSVGCEVEPALQSTSTSVLPAPPFPSARLLTLTLQTIFNRSVTGPFYQILSKASQGEPSTPLNQCRAVFNIHAITLLSISQVVRGAFQEIALTKEKVKPQFEVFPVVKKNILFQLEGP